MDVDVSEEPAATETLAAELADAEEVAKKPKAVARVRKVLKKRIVKKLVPIVKKKIVKRLVPKTAAAAKEESFKEEETPKEESLKVVVEEVPKVEEEAVVEVNTTEERQEIENPISDDDLAPMETVPTLQQSVDRLNDLRLNILALDHTALGKHVVKLELKELNTIRLNAEFVLALEACLLDIYGMLRPKPSDYEQRAVLVRAFNMWAKDTFGAHGDFPVVEAFGSFTMDLFTRGSDLDLSINFTNDYTTEVPRDEKISILKKFTKFLYKVRKKGRISRISPILKARVPVVKVVDSGTKIECDVSAENKDGVSRSSIFTIVSSIDERFQILSYLMKAWAKAHDINSSKDRTMNSLSIISLVAFHLQTRDPPILPPFSALLKDGTDVSSVQKIAVGFRQFGRRNDESVARLFLTLLIMLSAVERLWPQGLCVSTFEGSWIKKERGNGIGKLSIEDFLDRSQNCARAVGESEMKKIYKCIKGSLEHLSRLMEGEIREINLKERLFESFGLSISSAQLTSELVGLKRSFPLHEPDPINPKVDKRKKFTEPTEEPDPINPRVDKRTKFTEPTKEPDPINPKVDKRRKFTEPTEEPHRDLLPTSTNWSNPSLALNPRAPFQTSHAHPQPGYWPWYHPQPPIPPITNFHNPSIPLNPLSLFQPSHVGDHFKPFETSRSGYGRQYQPPSRIPQIGYRSQNQSEQPIYPQPAYGSVNQWQPPIGPNPGYHPAYHLQASIYPASGYRPQYQPREMRFTPQLSSAIDHPQGPLLPHHFFSSSGNNPPDRNLQRPGIMDARQENHWPGYSTQNLACYEGSFVPPQQFNHPDNRFPPYPHL